MLMAVEVVIVAVSVVAAIFIALRMGVSLGWELDRLPELVAGLAVCNNLVLWRLGLYSARKPHSSAILVQRLLAGTSITFALLTVSLFALEVGVSRTFLLLAYGLTSVMLVGNRLVMDVHQRSWAEHSPNSRRILVVGSGDVAEQAIHALRTQRSWGQRVLGVVQPTPDAPMDMISAPVLGGMDDLVGLLKEHSVDEVVFVVPRSLTLDLGPSFELCKEIGVDVRIVPSLYNPDDLGLLRLEDVLGVPMLAWYMSPINPSGYIYKRALDYTGGLVGFALFLILYPVIAICIKWDSPGPVLFRQDRVGQHGRVFGMYKFRTMVRDAEARKKDLEAENVMGGAMFKVDGDPRITRVGRVLRRYSLDEFPQFINVLRGEMSLVGTRPPTPDEVDMYRLNHRRRLSIRPGVTGLWQVSGRSDVRDFEEVVRLDLHYIDHWRFRNDLTILLRTVVVMFRSRGAQ